MIKRTVFLGVMLFVAAAIPSPHALTAAGSLQAPSAAAPAKQDPSSNPAGALVARYCVSCHSDRLKTGSLSLQNLDANRPELAADVWEKVVHKLRTQSMPPVGLPRPEKAAYESAALALETALDRAAAASPNPGRPSVHRLNRVEYTNAVRDLIALEIDGRSLLPPDDAAYGFDNIADNLTVSPRLMERYLVAARRVGRLAFGFPESDPAVHIYKIPKFYMQDERVEEEAPFGTRGGIAVRHYFPLDGDYTFQIKLERNHSEVLRGMTDKSQLEIRVDGQRVRLFTVGGLGKRPACYVTNTCPENPDDKNQADDGLDVRVSLKAGSHLIGVAFIDEQRAKPEGPLGYRATVWQFDSQDIGSAMVYTVTIGGPFNGKVPTDTPSRRAILVCQPKSPAEEPACANQIVSRLARRAFRRPVGKADVDMLMRAFNEGRRGATFDHGIERALRAMLVDPEFLFRIERAPATVKPGVAYRLTDIELASRLSFFLWSSIPDDELLDVAARGRLRDRTVLAQQVSRMLKDSRANALVKNFGGQWLLTRNVRLATPNPDEFSAWDENLREGFERETELFLASMIAEDRSILEMLTADYTYLDEQLAKFYGIPNVYGGHFRRVTLPEGSPRRGLLGKGSILLVTSYADRTSPVLRGKWLLENILGAPPPPPPPDVPPLDESTSALGPQSTMRERMERHRANAQCAACHARMDPLGLALENFDAIGGWRTVEANKPIDSSAALADGTKFSGPIELQRVLLSRGNEFVTTVADKLITYGVGRGMESYDRPALRQIVKRTTADNYRWSSLIQAIVESTPFQMRLAPSPDVEPPKATGAGNQ
jgi:cytochrome c553